MSRRAMLAALLCGALAACGESATAPVAALPPADTSTATPPATAAPAPWVIFDRSDGVNRDLWRVRLDGTGLARLTSNPAPDAEATAVAGRVVFTRYEAGRADLYAVPLEGGAEVRLTNTPGADEREPQLSEDGARLTYVQPTHPMMALGALLTARADGSGASPHPGTFPRSGRGSYSPNGVRLAFHAAHPDSSNRLDLWVAAQPGGPPVRLARNAESPAWGRGPHVGDIAFMRCDSETDSPQMGCTRTVWLYRITDGAQLRLSQTDRSISVAWAPDGRLVVAAYTPNGHRRLYWTEARDGAPLTPIPTGDGDTYRPAVHP